MKKISIIIPCYNAEKYLQECFDSIKYQTIGIQELQVIFVDDASADSTLEIIKKFEKEYPDVVRVIHLEINRKQGGARNVGLRDAIGKYVLFVDADDWLALDMCEKVYTKAEEYDIDILQFPFIHVFSAEHQEKDESIRYGYLDGTMPSIKKGLLLGNLFTFGSQNKLYKRSMLEREKAEFLEGVVYEEPYFVYPLLFEANRFYNMEEGLYFYRQTEPSVTVQYMCQDKKLYNHPFVQLELVKKVQAKTEYADTYYNEIEFHFLQSYYIETLYLAGIGNLYLGIDYFMQMQNTILQVFPTYLENPYIQLEELAQHKKILESVEKNMTQDELDCFCREVVEIMRE